MIFAQLAPTGVDPAAGPKMVDTYRFIVHGVPELHATTMNGSVAIKGTDGDAIVVTVTRRGADEAAMKSIVVTAVAHGSIVDVSSTEPNGCDACAASYEIEVPVKTNVDAGTQNGRIAISEVGGDVQAASKLGDLLCAGLSGNARLSSENGLVNASYSDLSHVSRIVLGTVNGGIRLLLPQGAQLAHLKAGTANGTITSPGLQLNVVKKDNAAGVNQTFGTSGPDVLLGTANGPISIIKLP